MSNILLSSDGFAQLEGEIKKTEDLYEKNSKEKVVAYETAVGDGWHDNF